MEKQQTIVVPEEIKEALRTYRSERGKDWIKTLQHEYIMGKDTCYPYGHLLRRFRNDFGPGKLASVNLDD